MTANDACRAIAPAAFRILGALVFAISPTWAGDRARAADGGEKGVRTLLPERPEGCFAQKGRDPFFALGKWGEPPTQRDEERKGRNLCALRSFAVLLVPLPFPLPRVILCESPMFLSAGQES